MNLWQPLESVLETEESAVLVLIQRADGSVPRGPGAGLVVLKDGSFHGTIGGGSLEWQALQHAALALKNGKQFDELDIPLGPGIGQCCGGFVSLSFELWRPNRKSEASALAKAEAKGQFHTRSARATNGRVQRLISDKGNEQFGTDLIPVAMFGAGHVGKAIMMSLSLIPVRLTWVDTRAEQFPSKAPANVSMHCPDDAVTILADLKPSSAILILTHSHAQDLEILRAALKSGFPFVGLIGSNTKRKRFESQLVMSGMEKPLATSFTCPIGLDEIAGKEPAIIAASVTAQILVEMNGNTQN
ncbi:MAG: xanthine dehydrogenase accessory protein XdhC [Rhizobiales bacterium]|nr:xanthine dehydrogenase accessory protein XdhC [Hyphomicrobiales bacterium]